MPDLHLAGQDTKVSISTDNDEVESITDINSFDATFHIERTQEAYQGRPGVSHDEFAMGCSGNIAFNAKNPQVLDFVMKLYERAEARVNSFKVNIMSTFFFPDGSVRLLIFRDAAFGNIPISSQGKTSHVGFTLDWAIGGKPENITA